MLQYFQNQQNQAQEQQCLKGDLKIVQAMWCFDIFELFKVFFHVLEQQSQKGTWLHAQAGETC